MNTTRVPEFVVFENHFMEGQVRRETEPIEGLDHLPGCGNDIRRASVPGEQVIRVRRAAHVPVMFGISISVMHDERTDLGAERFENRVAQPKGVRDEARFLALDIEFRRREIFREHLHFETSFHAAMMR
jgi:hypothetical protein